MLSYTSTPTTGSPPNHFIEDTEEQQDEQKQQEKPLTQQQQQQQEKPKEIQERTENLKRTAKATTRKIIPQHLESLIKIIRQGEYQDFLELLESGALKNSLNTFIEGQTALHYSLIYGRSLAWCKQLVINGANPNLSNFAGWHPIHLAAFNGSSETMRYLIDCLDETW